MGFTFQLDESAAKAAAGGGIKTGVFKLRVNAVAFEEDKKGNPRVNVYLQDPETSARAVVFGMCIAPKWTTGSDNSDYSKWQEFAQIVGMQTGAMAPMEVVTNKAGNKQTMTCFTECTGKIVNVALQETLDIQSQGKNAGQETNDKRVYRTFFEDGKSLAEKATNTEAKSIEVIRGSLKAYETKAYKARKAGGSPEAMNEPAGESEEPTGSLI